MNVVPAADLLVVSMDCKFTTIRERWSHPCTAYFLHATAMGFLHAAQSSLIVVPVTLVRSRAIRYTIETRIGDRWPEGSFVVMPGVEPGKIARQSTLYPNAPQLREHCLIRRNPALLVLSPSRTALRPWAFRVGHPTLDNALSVVSRLRLRAGLTPSSCLLYRLPNIGKQWEGVYLRKND